MTRGEWIAQLTESAKVTYLSPMRSGDMVILHTRDEELVNALAQRGAGVRWFDRTFWSSQKLGTKNAQAEVTLGPRFWQRVSA